MPDLTNFLLARITEDEQAAERVVNTPDRRWPCDPNRLAEDGSLVGLLPHGSNLVVTPARVLAECEAKRRIVNLYESPSNYGPDYGAGLYDALLALVQPYADHPDFDESWRVE